MNLNEKLVWLPLPADKDGVVDIDLYMDWDEHEGYGGADQIVIDNGIVVEKSDQSRWEEHLESFKSFQDRF